MRTASAKSQSARGASHHSAFMRKSPIRVPKRSLVFFYSKIQNSALVLKRPFVFYSKKEILQLYSHSYSFSQRNTKFRIVPKRPFVLWLRNTTFLKLFRDVHLLFDNTLKKLMLCLKCHSFFDHEIQNLESFSSGHLLLGYKQRK